jgi:hypothetical protein
MTMIDQAHDQRRPGTVTRPRLAQIITYLVVIATGLVLGAFIGLVLALFTGLIPLNC